MRAFWLLYLLRNAETGFLARLGDWTVYDEDLFDQKAFELLEQNFSSPANVPSILNRNPKLNRHLIQRAKKLRRTLPKTLKRSRSVKSQVVFDIAPPLSDKNRQHTISSKFSRNGIISFNDGGGFDKNDDTTLLIYKDVIRLRINCSIPAGHNSVLYQLDSTEAYLYLRCNELLSRCLRSVEKSENSNQGINLVKEKKRLRQEITESLKNSWELRKANQIGWGTNNHTPRIEWL